MQSLSLDYFNSIRQTAQQQVHRVDRHLDANGILPC
jgi:hypothetical protein